MKKTLSLVMALMMLVTMIFAIPVMADEPDGSQANPYYVTNPMTAPGFITIPANSTLYYQYNVMVFNGWSVEAYGLSAITVDGMIYDQPDMWGSIVVDFQFNFMSPGLVGYVNDSAEEVQVMLTHNEPVGSLDNPDTLYDGDNYLSIPSSIMEYVSVFVPSVSGDFTFSTEQAEDFQIIVFADAAPDMGGTPNFVENGSLTLTLESYMPVYVVVTPMGMTGDVVLTVTPPKAGSAANPIWLDSFAMFDTYGVEAGSDVYFQIDGSLSGNTLTIYSVAGANFIATIDGVEYASVDGKAEVALDSAEWYMELILSSAVDNEIAFEMSFAAGSMENPFEIGLGDTVISIPAGTDSGYFYTYVVEKDGLLIATPSDKSGIGYMDMADDSFEHYAYLMAESANSSMMIPVTAGEVITFNPSGLDDEETWEKLAVDFALTLTWEELVSFDTFEDGNLNGWGSTSPLTADDMEYISGWYSAKFEAAADWANIYKYINVEANTDYIVSFKAKAALEKDMWVKFNKDWAADVAQGDFSLTTEWADYTVTLNSGDSTSLVFMFQYAGYATDGQIIWLDDIVITKVPSEEPEVIPGDLDGNGKLNNRDLGLLQLYLNDGDLSDKTFIEAAGDLDGNGKLNNRDLGLLQKALNV